MSGLLLSRIDTDLLYPPFLVRLQALLDDALQQRSAFWVIEGFRTYKRSDELFAQGRTTPGPIVTRARAGQSAHNFGIAADLCLDGYMERVGLQPDYRPVSYFPLEYLCRKHGLVWGGAWPGLRDYPHVQMPDFVSTMEMGPLRDALSSGGMPAVWQHLDLHFARRSTEGEAHG